MCEVLEKNLGFEQLWLPRHKMEEVWENLDFYCDYRIYQYCTGGRSNRSVFLAVTLPLSHTEKYQIFTLESLNLSSFCLEANIYSWTINILHNWDLEHMSIISLNKDSWKPSYPPPPCALVLFLFNYGGQFSNLVAKVFYNLPICHKWWWV